MGRKNEGRLVGKVYFESPVYSRELKGSKRVEGAMIGRTDYDYAECHEDQIVKWLSLNSIHHYGKNPAERGSYLVMGENGTLSNITLFDNIITGVGHQNYTYILLARIKFQPKSKGFPSELTEVLDDLNFEEVSKDEDIIDKYKLRFR